MKKRILSLLLCFVLCLSFLPMGAFAEELPDESLTTVNSAEETSVEEIFEGACPAEGNQTEALPEEEPEKEESKVNCPVSAWLALQKAVQNGGTLTLTRDVVCDNQAYGPITVPQGVTAAIDLNGHTIDRNLTEAVEKGSVLDVYGSLTVKDGSSGKTGTITGGKNTGADNKMVAGGIQVSGGSLVLESGSITGCSSDERGAGVNIESGSFLMKGGSVSGNRAVSHGAGVNISAGTFTMTGGIISGNYANTGAGVCASAANLFLSGGEISGNTARDNAGGLNTFGTSNVTLTGCKITGNTAPKAGGVSFFLQDKGNYSFKVGKNTVITGNTNTDGNPSNLFLNNFNIATCITIMDGENAPNGMSIGISSYKALTASAPVQISDATMQNAYRGCFFSDNNDYWTDLKEGILYLTTEPPTCSVTYTGSDKVTFSGADGDLITSAKAGDTVRFKVTPDLGYTLGTVSVKTGGGTSVTIFASGDIYSFSMPADDAVITAGITVDVPTAVTGLGYDGSAKTGVEEGEGYTLTDNTAVNAGIHTATASLKPGYIWSDNTAEDKQIPWKIFKAAPTADLFIFTAPESLVAEGNSKCASVIFDTADGKLTGMGSVTVRYQKLGEGGWSANTTEAPAEPGTYRVIAEVSEGDNYTSASELTTDSWRFTITAPIYAISVTDDGHGTGNKTVYTKWNKENPNTGAELPFTDVKATDWSYDNIAYVCEKGLMQGTSETTFAPQLSTSRAMIVTILWRLEGTPVVNYAMSFTDVAPGQWYAEAIRWAQANNIVNGYSVEQFGTNDPITREQMAAILYRYAQTKGEGFTGSWMFLLDFEDRADISGWADEAMHWCVMKGLINGVGNDLLDPQGYAKREQVAAILHRFCENIVK